MFNALTITVCILLALSFAYNIWLAYVADRYETTIKHLYTFEALGREEAQSAVAGDIIAIVGVDDADVGDVVTAIENPVEMEPIEEYIRKKRKAEARKKRREQRG